MTLAATLLGLSLFAPQSPIRVPPPPIVLPPAPVNTKPGTVAPAQRPQSELERFRRDLHDLTGTVVKIENKLVDIGKAYPRESLESLQIEIARSARVQEMIALALVARRFGSSAVADELKFQLLTRPLYDATRPAVEAVVALYAADPQRDLRQLLRELIKGRVPATRRPATEILAARATAEDLPFALQLTSESSLEWQLRGIDLLRAIATPPALDRLLQLLSRDPALAAGACEALVALQAAAVPALQAQLAAPAIDRGYCYAAFALAQIGARDGRCLLQPEAIAPLRQRLADRDALTRALAAVALADLAFFGVDAGPEGYPDAAIVAAMVDVVDSEVFVSNLELLRRPAEARLVQFAGRVGSEALGWRDWWQSQRDGFVGIRAQVAVDPQSAPECVVTLRQDRQVLRLVGSGLADADPLPGAQEVLLTGAQMLAVVERLLQGGFGDPERMRAPGGMPAARSLQLQVRGQRMQVAMPTLAHAEFDALVHEVQQAVAQEQWQLYRHPIQEPDRGAFWRAERQWLDQHPGALERGQRLVRRICRNWDVLSASLRTRALEELFSRADRRQLLGEPEGERLLQIVQEAKEFGESELSLLELAAGAPGDRVWRASVDFAARMAVTVRPGTAGGAAGRAVRSVFAVLGPDAVLAALQDQNALVRRAAVEEVVRSRDLRAFPRLVELLEDSELDVRRLAIQACGQLQVGAASRGLAQLITTEDTPVVLRREALRALGRVGGPQAFAVLERAVAAPVQEDKEAALRGLGELRDPRAAHLLAELAVAGHGQPMGQLARFHLGRLGGQLAVPALRHQLDVVQEPAIRAQLFLLLGGYQDPRVVPDLLDLLRQPEHAGEAAQALACTTGYDLLGQSDRVGAMEAFWRRQRSNAQWQWFLEGLRVAEVPTVLRPEAFAPGAGNQPVPELARLLVECRQPQLRVLAAALLRTTTGIDFGVITLQSSAQDCEAVAARYRMLLENARSAQAR